MEQTELDLISAWLDGELDDRQSAEVAHKVVCDAAWAAEAEQLRRLDDLLNAWQVPPLRSDLTPEIVARTRRKASLPAWIHSLAPLAAAAAIFVAAWVFHSMQPPGPAPVSAPPQAVLPSADPDGFDAQVEQLLVGVDEEDRQVVQNLDILQDFDVLVSFDTLQALDTLDRRPGGS